MIYFLAAFKYTVSIVNCNRDYYLVIRSLCFLTTFTYLSHLQPPHYTITNGFSVSVSLILFSSVQFSPSVVSDSLRPHESQPARPLCPSPTPGVHSDSRPAISSSVVPFSSCPQSLPGSESFPMSQLFT